MSSQAVASEFLYQTVRSLAEGLDEDLRQYSEALVRDLNRAAVEGRPELAEEVYGQARLLAEMQRIRFVKAGSTIIVSTVLEAISRFLVSGVAGLVDQAFGRQEDP